MPRLPLFGRKGEGRPAEGGEEIKVDFRRKRIVRPVRAIPHRAQIELIQTGAAGADGLAVGIATWAAFSSLQGNAFLAGLAAAILFIVIKTVGGGYAMVRRRASGDYILKALQRDRSRILRDAITLVLVVAAGLALQFLLAGAIHPVETAIAAMGGAVLLPGSYLVRRWFSYRLTRPQVALQRSAVYGAGPAGVNLANRIVEGELGEANAVIGLFDERESRIAIGGGVEAVAGDWNTLLEFASNGWVDTIYLCMPGGADDRLKNLLSRMKVVSVDVIMAPQAGSEDGFTPLAERPIGGWNRIIKMLEDRLLGGLALILSLPLLGLIALAIRLDSRGPALYVQERVGFNNRPFRLYKFRSMYGEGDDALHFRQATRDDPRITRVGRLLRRTSLDELPQLFNVMLGDMSLVGPRPHAPGTKTEGLYFHEVMEDYAHRHRVKPGITGWAQVNGFRGETDTREKLEMRVRHDLYYIDNWSLALDIEVLIRTVIVILLGRNAY
jgi:Undecaprenyl-phosphate glucose phosphotransferase